ncbi:MAG: hypothetical protein ACKVWV_04995 [Planctomycetota bacterium]
MFDPATSLLSRLLETCAVELQNDPANPEIWAKAREALGAARTSDPDLAAVVDALDAKGLRAIVELWHAHTRPLPAQDQEVLRRAMKAFEKSLRATKLDDESRLGGRGMSGGRLSGILGIQPPSRFSREVWNELVRQGRLKGGHQGIYELGLG